MIGLRLLTSAAGSLRLRARPAGLAGIAMGCHVLRPAASVASSTRAALNNARELMTGRRGSPCGVVAKPVGGLQQRSVLSSFLGRSAGSSSCLGLGALVARSNTVFAGPSFIRPSAVVPFNLMGGSSALIGRQSVMRFPGNRSGMRSTAGKGRFRVTAAGNIKWKQSGRVHGMRKFSRTRNRKAGVPRVLEAGHPELRAVRRMLKGIKRK